MLPALIALLSGALLEIPPSNWKMVNLPVPQNDTTVDCRFEVRSGSRVQVMLADRRQAERFHRGRSFRPIYSSGFENNGRFRVRLPDAGQYVLIVDNRIEGRGPTRISMDLNLSGPNRFHGRELPPERRKAVVALSLLFFGAVVVFSARQYLRHA